MSYYEFTVEPFTNLVESSVLRESSYNDNEVTVLRSLIDKTCKSGYVELKKLIRNLNLPSSHPLRKSLWPQLLSVRYSINIQVPDSDMQSNDISPENIATIDNTSMAGYEFSNQMLLPTFFLNSLGRKCLRMILHSIFIERPELVYAPQLWPLTALFLHYMPITVTRKCILTLLDQPGVLIQTKSSWKEHCLALEELAYMCNLLRRMNRKRKETLSYAPNKNNDNICKTDLFVGRPKVFYRAGLIILKVSLSGIHKEVGSANNRIVKNDDTSQVVLHLEETFKYIPFTPSKLMRKMFTFRNFSRTKITEALKNTQYLEVNFDFDKELVQVCNKTERSTFAAYLLGDNAMNTHPSECISSKELASVITSIEDHGNSLRTFYAKAAETQNPATILLVRSSSKSSIIGAFCSDRWQPRAESTYYGNGFCFLFRIKPGPFVIYRWIGSGSDDQTIINSPQYQRFQRSSNNGIEIGGSMTSGPPGLSLDSCLTTASTGPSSTFSNPCLISDPTDLTHTIQCENGQIGCMFTVGLVELIGFTDL
ncbi:unnamed protein product [Heterobilharzia americana]|nr:unnamed protein product [Heterobilharzia americana]